MIDQNEFFDKRIASKDASGYFLLKNGEFAYNKSYSNDAPWGAVKRLDRYENGILSTLYIVFELSDKNKTDSDFIVSYYDTALVHLLFTIKSPSFIFQPAYNGNTFMLFGFL